MEVDTQKGYQKRHDALRRWYNCDTPTVMVIGYAMFRLLTAEVDDTIATRKQCVSRRSSKKLLKYQHDFQTYLQNPGLIKYFD